MTPVVSGGVGGLSSFLGIIMGYTIAFSNQKGGTAKTTTVINTAGALAENGYNILVVDMDPQASLTVGLGLDAETLEHTMYDVLLDNLPIQTLITSIRDNVDIAPTNITLSAAEISLNNQYRREDRLLHAIAPVKDNYDLILVDCPPSLGILTINALSAADGIVVPMSCAFYSLMGIKLLFNTLEGIKQQINPDLETLGVLPTMYDRRTKHANEVLELVRTQLDGHVHVFDTIIRMAVKMQEAPVAGQTITEYAPKHPGSQDYRDFAAELIQEVNRG